VRKDNLKVAERRIICKYIAFIMSWIIYGGSICCCQTNIVRFLCVSSARYWNKHSPYVQRNTAHRFSHVPICPRLGHPPPSCSATPVWNALWMQIYILRVSRRREPDVDLTYSVSVNESRLAQWRPKACCSSVFKIMVSFWRCLVQFSSVIFRVA